jgi:hypothetical protein
MPTEPIDARMAANDAALEATRHRHQRPPVVMTDEQRAWFRDFLIRQARSKLATLEAEAATRRSPGLDQLRLRYTADLARLLADRDSP